MAKIYLTESAKKQDILRRTIRKNMIDCGMTSLETLAKKTSISRTAMYSKVSGEREFTLGELRRVCMVLHFTPEQKLEIL